MKNAICLFVFIAYSVFSFAQQSISGVVMDSESSQLLVGANISLNDGQRNLASNADGKFVFSNLDSNNDYKISISYIGYKTQVLNKINTSSNDIVI